MSAQQYLDKIGNLIGWVSKTQIEAIERAAEVISKTVVQDGILYTFGTGHSHLIAEDVVYRAGGLAPVDVILEPSLVEGAAKSEQIERLEGFGRIIAQHYNLQASDALLIVSNSGRNTAPVELAIEAQARRAPVIAITSLAYSQNITSRHSSGKKLYEVADVVIDNGAPLGDACIQMEGLPVPTGAVSSVTGMMIIHAIMVQTVRNLLNQGIEPPVFRSGNLDGSDTFNAAVRGRYHLRIRSW